MVRVNRKFVIFVGKKTVNGMCFMNEGRTISFYQQTLGEEETAEFFENNKLTVQYLDKLIEVINRFISNFEHDHCKKEEISIYATSEFRESLDENEIILFKMKIFAATGVHAFILTKELEELYIKNIIPECQCPRYIIRIMSTATVIYFINDADEVKQYRIENIGTAKNISLLNESNSTHKKIRERMDENTVRDYVEKLKSKIIENMKPKLEEIIQAPVIYLGGEIQFLKTMGFKLDDNYIFKDEDHKNIISYDSFYRQSIQKVLGRSQEELNEQADCLDIGWREGMKQCTLIAIALFQLLGIKTIIPSDKKEFYGMHYKNFQNVVVTGSKKKDGKEIEEWIQYFKQKGINVYSPKTTNEIEESSIMEEAHHLQAINRCDTLIVCNSNDEGYIGDSTLFDIGYAIAKEKRVIVTKKPKEDIFRLVAVEIGIYGRE